MAINAYEIDTPRFAEARHVALIQSAAVSKIKKPKMFALPAPLSMRVDLSVCEEENELSEDCESYKCASMIAKQSNEPHISLSHNSTQNTSAS